MQSTKNSMLLFTGVLNIYELIQNTIDHLHILDLILKLYVLDIFLLELFPLQKTKWFPFHVSATERTKNFSTVKPAYAVTFIKESPVLKGNCFTCAVI